MFFWSNPDKVMKTLIEMLELSNFGYMTAFKTEFNSRDKILLVTSWIKTVAL